MRKITILVCFILGGFSLFSQVKKDSFVFGISGNYLDAPTESGVTTNYISTDGKSLDVCPYVGYALSANFEVGVGLDYQWGDERTASQLYLINKDYYLEGMKVKTRSYIPYVYGRYSYKVINKFYVGAVLNAGYGKMKTKVRSMYLRTSVVNYIDESRLVEYVPSIDGAYLRRETTTEIGIAELSPEITYFLFPKVGFNIVMGGIGYAVYDWKKENSNWMVDFRPRYWEFGVKIVL